jgi:hypothetical protein
MPMRPSPEAIASTNADAGFEPEPLTAATLANRTVNEVTLAARRLRLKRSAVLDRPSETPTPVWIEVRRDVQTIGDGLQFLQSLERERLVEFGGASRACMSEAQQHFARGAGPAIDSRQEIQKFVQSLTMCPLDDLERSLRYTQRATLNDPFVIRRILQKEDMEKFIRQYFFITPPTDLGNGRTGTFQVMIRMGNPNQEGVMLWRNGGRVETSGHPDDAEHGDAATKTLKKRD